MRNRLHQTVAAVALLSILALGAADGVVRLLAERRLEIPYRNGLPDGAREALVTFNGLLLRATGRRMVSGTRHADVLRLDNGQLALCPLARTGRLRRKAVRDIARALAGVRDELARSGTPLVFVLCPSKVPPGGVGLPAGMEDDDNLLADLLVERLGQNGIECLDLRRRIAEEGLDHASLFFRTDHHWTPAAGLWAANETAAFLRDRHGFPADLSRTAPERFESRRIADRFLGSFGRRAGLGYAGSEPFDAVLPRFPTDFAFDVPQRSLHAEGGFAEAFLRGIGPTNSLYQASYYDSYLASNPPFVRIENRSGGNGRTLCVVKDSFACVLLPPLAIHYGRIVLLDPRLDPGLSLFRIVRDEGADAVLFVLNPNSLIRPNGFFGRRFLQPLPPDDAP